MVKWILTPPRGLSMLPDWVLNLGPLTYESGALPIALRGPANMIQTYTQKCNFLGMKMA